MESILMVEMHPEYIKSHKTTQKSRNFNLTPMNLHIFSRRFRKLQCQYKKLAPNVEKLDDFKISFFWWRLYDMI